MRLIYLALTLLFSVALTTALAAQDRGLHNSSKRFVDPSQVTSGDIRNPAEMQRTWAAAIVRVPNGKGRSKKLRSSRLAGWTPRGGERVPAVVYLHGCSGVWNGTHRRVKMMADLGFVVVAPASMAREKYAQSCDAPTHQGGMFRPVLKIRQSDAAYAVARLRQIPGVDPNRIVIMGLSEGGITTATLRPQPGEVARIVEGWTCHAGWQEYKGVNAGRGTPVLTLVGSGDPWFQDQWTKGECGRYLRQGNGSRSVVYRSGNLAREHELLEQSAPRQEVSRFLREVGVIR